MDNEKISDARLCDIISNLVGAGSERENVEFKEGNADPKTTGKNISAIVNSMILRNYPRGYIVWGVSDACKIVGTTFNPFTKRVGNEDFILWLNKHISPAPEMEFREIFIKDKRIVALIIESTPLELCNFENVVYIRVGANTRPLQEFPILSREILLKIVSKEYESNTAKSALSKEEVARYIDMEAFYRMRQRNVLTGKDIIFEEAINSSLVKDNQDSTYDITNLGALLYAKNLTEFPHLAAKSIRVIYYQGDSRLQAINEYESSSGYALEFDKILQDIMSRTQVAERIDADGIRRNQYLYPEITIRELFANVLAHQDFTNNTIHPMVEVFDNRIEFSNPGEPIIPRERFVDYPPQTRNRKLCDELRKIGICESRGSGWDKVAMTSIEQGYRAPMPEVLQDVTRVTLTQRCTLEEMTTDDRIWNIYIYACWLWTHHEFLTNAHIRKIFKLPEEKMSKASILIGQVVKKGLIKVFDEAAGTRGRKYLPNYAEINSP